MKKHFIILAVAAVVMTSLFSCTSSSSKTGGKDSPFKVKGEIEGTVKINYNEYRQVIDGFGGSNAWTRLPGESEMAEEVVKLLYSRTEGIGLTILRNRIPFRERLSGDDSPSLNDGFVVLKADNTYDYRTNSDGTKTFNLNWNAWDIDSTKNLIRRIKNLNADGPEKLTIMSTPWTPPNNRVTRWKEDIQGAANRNHNYTMDWSRPDWWGRLKRAHYNDYADLLADYVLNFESNMGASLSILSVQNEPNWKTEYESAFWDGLDLRDFIKVIGQRFPMKGIKPGNDGIGIMMPEYENFDVNFNNMIKPSLDDPGSEKIITHIGLHQYNAKFDASTRAGTREFPEITASGKRFWQTEISSSGNNIPLGNGIQNALFWARMIHWDMSLAQTNAFLFWWLWSGNEDVFNDGGSLLFANSYEIITAHRLYAMGQFSRFVRPGWRRIDSTIVPIVGTYSSAYRNPLTDEIAIVIINERATDISFTLDLTGAEFISLDSYRTSENEKLEFSGSKTFSDNKIDVTLTPFSITTFYGKVK